MKKILNLSLILFVFCLTSLLGGLFLSPTKVTSAVDTETSSEPIEISNATELKDYIDNYGQDGSQYGPDDYVVLTRDINMATLNTTASPDGDIVYGTIGTEENPFSGTFDGRGYSISNLRIDVSVNTSEEGTQNNQYAGLFGVTNGATIKNVAISQNMTITTGGCITLYVGTLVGRAENTTIQYCQITSKITHNTGFDCNVNFGTLVGMAVNSTISDVVCRYTGSEGFGNWNFDNKDNKVLNLGGVVGVLSNSELSFAVVSVKFFVNVSADFIGDLSVGGVVGNVAQSGSKVINIASENSFTVTNNISSSIEAIVNIGEIVGAIANNSPASRNISYIHFKANQGIERFGSMGNYAYTDQSLYDYITVANESMTTSAYFENQVWHPLYGIWDFNSVWYVGSSSINLQSFYGSFNIAISNALNTDVLTMTSTLQPSYRYGDQIAIDFSFNSVFNNGAVSGDMSKYYSLSAVVLNGVEVASIVPSADGTSYRISEKKTDESENNKISWTQLLDITKNNDSDFTLYIRNVNMTTAGEYSISITAEGFEADVVTKLFQGDNADQLVEGETPGYVFYAEGSENETSTMQLRMVYGQTYRIETKGKPNTPNAFVGWFLTVEDGDDISLSTTQSRILEFTFGNGYFTDDCEIYAKYRDNACVVTVDIKDEGILKVDFYSGDISLENAGETVSVSKEESSLKLEIYVKKGYDFNAEQFIVDLDVYKTEDPTKTFCTLRESYENDEYKYYHFVLDMTTLTDDFENAFTISCSTTPENDGNLTWLWITIGCVSGAVVIGLLIFLIVFLVRRKKIGGGSSGGVSFKKKNYKNMYY